MSLIVTFDSCSRQNRTWTGIKPSAEAFGQFQIVHDSSYRTSFAEYSLSNVISINRATTALMQKNHSPIEWLISDVQGDNMFKNSISEKIYKNIHPVTEQIPSAQDATDDSYMYAFGHIVPHITRMEAPATHSAGTNVLQLKTQPNC